MVTPIMSRVQGTRRAKEMVFIDSTGHIDSTGCTVTIISTNTKAGSIPLCVLYTQKQTETNYTRAFRLFKEHFPNAFGGKSVSLQFLTYQNLIIFFEKAPEIVITDDSSAERNALRAVWPSASLLLCIYHVLQSEWRWLLSHEKQDIRQEIMGKFQKV